MVQLLGELYADREYLEMLSKDSGEFLHALTLNMSILRTGLVIGNKDKSIYTLIQEGVSYLDSRTEFWRQQKPMYARKREKELKKWKPSPTRPQNPTHSTRPAKEVDYTKYVLNCLEEIDTGLSSLVISLIDLLIFLYSFNIWRS